MTKPTFSGTPGNARLALFASGDFACNLYWQSLTLFLFFFYTDVIGLAARTAGLLMLAGAIWDGIADIAIGAWAERMADYRRCILVGAAPLGVAFMLLYTVPAAEGAALAAIVLTAHLAFRTLYAVVNIPFVAISARISRDSAARGRIAAYRMLFGTAATIVVALVTRALSLTRHGTLTSARGYLFAAAGFAIAGTAILLGVARIAPPASRGPSVRRETGTPISFIAMLLANRAFLTLNLASAAAVVAAGVLNGGILFYFTYVEHDAAAGPSAMAWMGIAGAAAIPAWMKLRDRIGTRALWLVNAALALVLLASFGAIGPQGVFATQVFLFLMQVSMIGFSFAFWAMLPDTVEWGEYRSGRRLEAITFGVAGFGQKLALGAAGTVLGLSLQAAGYSPGGAATDVRSASIRTVLLAVPAIMVMLSALAMAANPFRRDTHAALVGALAERHADAREQ